MTVRTVKRIAKSQPALEGAGVHLQRAFGFGDPKELDPFLLFDDFRNDEPAKYLAGFPWHPHRGIETITYMLAGSVEHRDSIGNRGVLGAGDVQWMTAGSGIIHQEMPRGDEAGRNHGFQLWANLPARHKMTAPRYQEFKGDEIPVVEDRGSRVRVVCGEYGGTRGPVEGIAAAPVYLDVSVPPGEGKSIPVDPGHRAFAYVFAGAGRFEEGADARLAPDRSLVVLGPGSDMVVHAADGGVRFLLVSGAPLGEPVAWRGPIVMNTQEELDQAFRELEQGTFLGSR